MIIVIIFIEYMNNWNWFFMYEVLIYIFVKLRIFFKKWIINWYFYFKFDFKIKKEWDIVFNVVNVLF